MVKAITLQALFAVIHHFRLERLICKGKTATTTTHPV